MEKHEFVPYEFDPIYCGHDFEPIGSCLPGKLCMNLESDPIHTQQPEQRRWEETFPACIHCGHPGEHHDEEFGNCQESIDPECECLGYEAAAQPASEPKRVSDKRREEIIDAGTNCFKTCTPSEGEKLALELRTLRAQLAEKEAAIEQARRDALEEAAASIPTTWLDPLLSGSSKVVAKSPCNEIEALLLAVTKRIRALAAQEKEG